MLRTLEKTDYLKRGLQKTVYFDEKAWKLFESVRGDLKTIFSFLKTPGCEAYWRQNVPPKIIKKITKLENDLPKFEVIANIEEHLGDALPSNQITIYLLYIPLNDALSLHIGRDRPPI